MSESGYLDFLWKEDWPIGLSNGLCVVKTGPDKSTNSKSPLKTKVKGPIRAQKKWRKTRGKKGERVEKENARLKDREGARVNNAVFNILAALSISYYCVWFPLSYAFKTAHLFILRRSPTSTPKIFYFTPLLFILLPGTKSPFLHGKLSLLPNGGSYLSLRLVLGFFILIFVIVLFIVLF